MEYNTNITASLSTHRIQIFNVNNNGMWDTSRCNNNEQFPGVKERGATLFYLLQPHPSGCFPSSCLVPEFPTSIPIPKGHCQWPPPVPSSSGPYYGLWQQKSLLADLCLSDFIPVLTRLLVCYSLRHLLHKSAISYVHQWTGLSHDRVSICNMRLYMPLQLVIGYRWPMFPLLFRLPVIPPSCLQHLTGP